MYWSGTCSPHPRARAVQQIDVSFLGVCRVIDYEFRHNTHNIVKVAVDPLGNSRVDP